MRPSRAGISAVVLALALLSTPTGCGTDISRPTPPGPTLASQSRPLAGDERLQPDEHLASLCGNGTVNPGEQCDDGNLEPLDGCDTDCRVEPGYACSTPASGPSVCAATCGNGVLNVNETCDDQNTKAGDGCSPGCRVETGYSCSGAPSTCVTLCGDGIAAGPEACDDGNRTGGDTCSPRCLWEVGQSCMASNVCDGVCNPTTHTCALANVCGNGLLDEGEQCDDGNVMAGDGCATPCTIEAGYSCSGNPSVCAVRCGDGIKASSEVCDDGNTASGDGCDSACTVESGCGCQNTGVHAVFTRRGRTDCTQVSSLTAPSLDSSTSQSVLSVPGRYRMHYVSGAVSYSGGANWYPGILGVNLDAGAGMQGFSLGFDTPAVPPSATREEAMTLGFPLLRDFDAVTGEVRLALIDTDCGAGDNSDTAVTYRVDALSICQRIPAITSPSSGGVSSPSIGGAASPGATVHVYIDGGTTPACTTTADASGHWTCTLSGVEAGPHSAVVTSTIVGATETAPALVLTPRAAPVITGPRPDSVLATSTPALSGTADPGSLVTVREVSTVLCTATADDSGKWSCTPSTPLADGPHTVTATASNSAGSTSPVSNSVAFTTDTQAPDTTLNHGPVSRTEDNAAAFGYASNENGVRYECSLDGKAYAPCEDAYDVKPGEHTLSVRAVDAAGNVDATPAVYTWMVEDTHAFAGGGCNAVPASSWLALLGLLGLRRPSRVSDDS